jgi:FkbM family methyltransferase
MNPDYNIIANQCALGDKPGDTTIRISNEQNIGWNTMVFLSEKKEKIKEEFKVPVLRLDSYIKEKALDKIALIKIDVEGFEFPVLKGLSGYFENTDTYPAIICEINPFACSILGYTLTQLAEYMQRYNYNAHSLVNFKIKMDVTKIRELADVIFLPSAHKKK